MRSRLVAGAVALSIGGVASAAEVRPITMALQVPGSSPEELAQMRDEMLMSHVDAAWVIYLNPNGGRFTAGWPDDSRANQSSVLSAVGMGSADLPAYSFGDASWQTVLGCVRDLYADFDVYVTDEDPGDTPHMETIVGGHPNDINLPGGVGGIAPSGCEPIANSVQYVFPETYGPGGEQGICEAAGQETAHSFGLEHQYLCQDIMTYLWDCPENKTFVDEYSPCGEYSPRNCSCGAAEQNSYQHLMDWIGPHPETTPPTVTITSPDDGETVSAGFGVAVDATDDGTITAVHLRIDDAEVEVDNESPYEFTSPGDLAVGDHVVEAVAFDDDGAEARDSITVTVEPGGGSECDDVLDPCPPGQECVDGTCRDDGIVGDGDGDGGGTGLDGKIGYRGGGCRVVPAGASRYAIVVLALVALVLFRRRLS